LIEGAMRLILRIIAAGFMIAAASAAMAQAGGVTMPVPTTTLYQGDVLTEDMLTEQRFFPSASQLPAYHTSREAVVGKVARRVLPAGHAIPINALREPYLFKEGERVSLVFTAGGLSIEASGFAIQAGVVGSMISVRNADTGIIVRGIVQADGRVQVVER
jgi:flagella basal body P-ring formation protein FlgA